MAGRLTDVQRSHLARIGDGVGSSRLPMGITAQHLWLLRRKGLVTGDRFIRITDAGRAALASQSDPETSDVQG